MAEALQAAIGEDASSADEPMRALVVVFRDLHPKVDDFAKAWLADAPGDPLAETARVWQIYAQAGA